MPIPNLTHNQHLRWSIDDDAFGIRTDQEQRFRFSIGIDHVTAVSSWYEEFRRAMRLLVEEHGRNLAVFYSGGFDSEILLRTLISVGAHPEAHTIVFSGGENLEETAHTEIVCESLRVPHIQWVHDTESYIRGRKYERTAYDFQVSQLAYITVLDHVRYVTDRPALMGGEIYVQRHQSPGLAAITPEEWYYIYREDEDGCSYRYTRKTGHTLINEVFSYTPELMLAWMNIPAVHGVTDGSIPGKLSLLSSKKRIFSEAYPDSLSAERKLHGYENLMWTNQVVRSELKRNLLPMGTAQIPVSRFYDRLQLINKNT